LPFVEAYGTDSRLLTAAKYFLARHYDFFSVKFIAEKPDICLFAVARPQQMSHKELGIVCELVHIVDCR
jgi:hypothetical protein